MVFEAERVMFEIYKEVTYQGRFKVVYFTELGDHNREFEINRALAGKHYYDGFIRNYRRLEAKQVIKGILEKLNRGEQVSAEEIDVKLEIFKPNFVKKSS